MPRLSSVLLVALVFAGCTAERQGAPATRATSRPAAASPAPSPTAAPTPSLPADPFALATRYESPDPQTLVRRLAASEAAIADVSTPPAELAEAGRLQQAAYRQLVTNADWEREARAALPELEPSIDANVSAGRDLRALTQPREALPPDWEIVAPASADELLRHYRAAEAEFEIHWSYLAAIHLVETRMGRIRGTSIAGAQGPMQFMPRTWAAYGEGDINSNADSIRAAARYLVANGGPGDMPRALWAYNHSDRYVRAVSAYAGRMQSDERAFRGYYHWEVYYRTTAGDALLPVGWRSPS